MIANKEGQLNSLAFLSVIEIEDVGHCGGYLILNLLGRPLEFHCTVPVKPNRAQEILYGQTLYPFLYGEQIGSTLVKRSKLNPSLICTDVQHALSLRESIETPVVLVEHGSESPGDHRSKNDEEELADSLTTKKRSDQESNSRQNKRWRFDSDHDSSRPPLGGELFRFQAEGNELAISHRWSEDQVRIEKIFAHEELAVDVSEPFERIHEAIREAQKSARA